MSRIYYCNDCEITTEFKNGDDEICKCGYVFGKKFSDIKNYINMRTTWSGQTKIEFSQTTIDKDIAERNSR